MIRSLLFAVAAQAEPAKIIELRVPEPTEMPPLPPPPSPVQAGPDGAPGEVPASGEPRGRPRPRSQTYTREVTGISPTSLWGRYQVFEVTEGGETESFASMMERSSMALQADCVTVGMVLDFGKQGTGWPQQLQIAEYRHCTKGGLGTYASELALAIPATFESTPAGLQLDLPAVKAFGALVRVRPPSTDDLSTPSHWMGPKVEMSRGETRYTVIAEYARNAKETDPAVVLHLVSGASASTAPGSPQVVLHLVPVGDPNAWMHEAAAPTAGTGN